MAWNSWPAVRAGIVNLEGLRPLDRVVLQLIRDAWLSHDDAGASISEIADVLGATKEEVRYSLQNLDLGGHIRIKWPTYDSIGNYDDLNGISAVGCSFRLNPKGGAELKDEKAGQAQLPIDGVPRTREQAGYQEITLADRNMVIRADVAAIKTEVGQDGSAGYSLDIRVCDCTLGPSGTVERQGQWVTKLAGSYHPNQGEAWERFDVWREGYSLPGCDLLEECARECHETNRMIREEIGEDAGPSWEDAPQEMRDSTYVGIRFALDNPDATPEQQHQAWLEHKVADGWVYGDVKDIEAKTHPCMVPYAELPEAQRLKDAKFLEIVGRLRASLASTSASQPVENSSPFQFYTYEELLASVKQQAEAEPTETPLGGELYETHVFSVPLECGESVACALNHLGRGNWSVRFGGPINESGEYSRNYRDKAIKADPEGWALKEAERLRGQFLGAA